VKALFDAIKAGDAESVRALLDGSPALVNAADDSGMRAFVFAKYNRQDAIARLLLDRGAELDVFAAAMTGDAGRLLSLLKQDPSLAVTLSHDGWTALHLAAFFGHVDCARALLDGGANVHKRSTNAMQNAPLHAAAAGRHLEIARLLIEHDADVNARQHGGWTALHAAAQSGNAELAQVLIGAGADTNLRADNGQCAMDLALTHGHQQVVEILEHFGAASA
jgi:ankyrin repeat protein